MQTDMNSPTPGRVELERAGHAQAAADNPLIAEALAAWEQEITESWKTSPLRDAEGREKLRLMLEAAQHFQRHLQRVMETGQLQRVAIRRRQTVLERVQGAWTGR